MRTSSRILAYTLAALQAWVPLSFEWQGAVAFAEDDLQKLLQNATEGQRTGAEILRYQNNTMRGTSIVDQHVRSTTATTFKTAEDAKTLGAGGQINLQEFGLGGDLAAGRQLLNAARDNPDQLNELAKQARHNLQERGCPATTFQYMGTETVLRVTPVRRTLVPQSGGSTKAEDSLDTSYSGPVNVKYPTIGHLRNWDQAVKMPEVGNPGQILRYEATPFTVPNDGTSFTFNHRIIGSAGSPVVLDYGNKANGYATETLVYGSPTPTSGASTPIATLLSDAPPKSCEYNDITVQRNGDIAVNCLAPGASAPVPTLPQGVVVLQNAAANQTSCNFSSYTMQSGGGVAVQCSEPGNGIVLNNASGNVCAFSGIAGDADGQTTVACSATGATSPHGGAVFVIADLYRVKREFTPQPVGGCALDPSSCIVSGVNFCGPPGLGVLDVFRKGQSHKKGGMDLLMASASAINYDESDADAAIIVNRGTQIFKGTDTVFNGTDPVFGALFSGCTETANYTTNTVTVHTPNIKTCSMPRVSLPKTCNGQRGTHFVYLQESTVLTANFYRFVKVPLINPNDGKPARDKDGNIIYVYEVQPAVYSGVVDINVPTFGGARSWDSSPDANGYFVRYDLTPFSVSPNEYFPYEASVASDGTASASFSSLGSKTDNWSIVANASVSGSSQLRVNAKLYHVVNNILAGCEDYMKLVSDGFCKPKITCTENRGPCTTLDGVSFCDGGGIAQLLKPWGVEDSAHNGGNLAHGITGGGAIEVLPRMCWAAVGAPLDCSESFTGALTCYTDIQGVLQCPSVEGAGLGNNFGEAPEYADDCASPSRDLFNNATCRLVSKETCTEGADGLFSGICYNKTVVYDCGTDRQATVPGGVSFTQSCGSPIRCLGTECHNPKGEANGDFGMAVASTSMVDMAGRDMVCAETGALPTTASDVCTPVLFNGVNTTCKIPIGNQIGITPNCCKDSEEAAKSAPGAIQYLQLVMYSYKMGIDKKMVGALSNLPGMEGFGQAFYETTGAVKSAFDGAVSSTKTMLSDAVSQFGKEFGFGSTAPAQCLATDPMPLVTSAAEQAMGNFYEFCARNGLEDFATNFVVKTGGEGAAQYAATELLEGAQAAMEVFNTVMIYYTILKIIGHIVFKCTNEELQLGIQKKQGLCHYVGDYCAKKGSGIACIEQRESYCCYKSALARIVAEQIRTKAPQIAGDYGFPSIPRCGGFTPAQLTAFDWSQFDPTEWLSLLQDAGLIPDSTTKADTMYALASSKAALATGSANVTLPEINQQAYTMERYSPLVETYSQRRQDLASQPVCYNDPQQMAWYGKPPVKATCVAGETVELRARSAQFGSDPCWGGDFLDFSYICDPTVTNAQSPPVILKISRDDHGNREFQAQYQTTDILFDTELTFSNCKARLTGETVCNNGSCDGIYKMWISWWTNITNDPSLQTYSSYGDDLTITPNFKVYELQTTQSGQCYWPNGTEGAAP